MLQSHAGVVMDLVVWTMQDQSVLLSTGMCGHIKVWTLGDGGQSKIEFDHDLSRRGGGFSLAVMSNNAGTPLLLSGHNDGSVLVHELPTFLDRGQLGQAHDGQVWALTQVTPGWLCSGAMDSSLKLWQFTDGQE